MPPPHAREMAACLACGSDAFVSRASAGVVWRILAREARPARVDILTTARRRQRKGIRLHHVSTLEPGETIRFEGLPITIPERTLFDLAMSVPLRTLERALAEAFALRLTTTEKLTSLLERHRRRRGYRRLTDLLDGGRSAHTRSEFERRFLALVHRARLGTPAVNTKVAGHRVDFYWPGEKVVVETDGFAFHSSRRSFEGDRSRDLDLASTGIQVVRVTWKQWTKEPEVVLAHLAKTLARAAERRGLS